MKYVRRQIYETTSPAGLLQPVPIHNQAWLDISMDFIKGLSMSQGYNTIFVVVDKFTKYEHFIALTHPYTAASVAQVFLNSVFKLHGLSRSIVSDKDPIFLSSFWKIPLLLHGSSLNFSSAYHL